MTAEEILREGKPAEALKTLQGEVRANPANAELRTFLFQLLAITGQWDRALNQLAVVGEMDASTFPMVQTYGEAIKCEALRAPVFAGERTPLVFGEPEEWIALIFEALRLTCDGRHKEAGELREKAFEGAPTTAGSIDGTRFEWIADADSRMGPMLEVILEGRYYWAPFHRISEIRIEEPADLRDLVWTPATFSWTNGGQAVGLIPTRYVGAESDADPQIQLARKTDWNEQAPEVYFGAGQRLLATDVAEYPIMDVRVITLDTADGAAVEEPPPSAAG